MVSHDYINRERLWLPPVLIASAATMWGSIGIFGSFLISEGISPSAIGCLRLLVSSLFLFIYFINGRYSYFKIRWHDFAWLFAMALLTQTTFNFTYYKVISEMGVTKAGILLYTMPIFLIVWSVVIFEEKLNARKVLGIILCVIGSFIALTGGVLDCSSFTVKGLILGIITAVSFSLMSVFSKILMKRLNPLTVIFYAFFLGALMMVPFVDIQYYLPQLMTVKSLTSLLGLAFVGTVFPFILYFKGIDMGVDLSKAGVISVIELISAILLATIILGEHLNVIKLIGIMLIVLAIVVIQNGSERLR